MGTEPQAECVWCGEPGHDNPALCAQYAAPVTVRELSCGTDTCNGFDMFCDRHVPFDSTPSEKVAAALVPAGFVGNYVPGVGPVPCKIAFVGEAPGAEEDEALTPFVGLSGAVLDCALMRYGMPRHTVYVTNLYKRRPSLENDDPTEEQQAEGLRELLPELAEVNPEIVVCVGRLAAKAVMGSHFADMDTCHGVPVFLNRIIEIDRGERAVTYDGRWVIPIIHPAAGMHEPKMMDRFDSDMRTVGRMMNGWRPAPQPQIATDYKLTRAPHILVDGAIDTEGVPGAEWCASWSYFPGQSLVMKAADIREGKLILGPQDEADVQGLEEATLRGHHWLWDFPIVHAMTGKDPNELGIRLRDSMILAFVLQDEPQGLKDLAYKYLGKLRNGFQETVGPHWLRAVQGWVERQQAVLQDWVDLHIQEARLEWEALQAGEVKGKPKKWTKAREAATVKELVADPRYDLWKRLSRTVKDTAAGKPVDLGARMAAVPPEQVALCHEPLPPYTLDVVPEPEMIEYTGSDSDDTLRVSAILEKRVRDEGLEEVADIDHSILPMLYRFQTVGLPIDVEYGQMLGAQLEVEMMIHREELAAQVGELTGKVGFNAGSPDQVAEVLTTLMQRARADDYKMRMTKSRARISTDDKALEDILRRARAVGQGTEAGKQLRVFVDGVRAYRANTKNKSTFVDPIVEAAAADPGGRLHYKTKYTRIYTGRIAYENPNVGAIPRDPRIRALIAAKPGRKIVTVDLSQIEPRTMAHLSRDPELTRIYREGRDLYAETASKILNKPLKEVGKGTDIRQIFKVVDLSLIYLISAPSLYDNLLWEGYEMYTLDQIFDIRRDWFRLLAGVMPYYERIWGEARQAGYVKDIWGRRRFLPNIYLHEEGGRAHWVNKRLASMRAEAERQAGNHTIQGAAQGLMKRAMARVWDEVVKACWSIGVYCEPLLQIHDELLLEVEEQWAEWVALKVEECMERDGEWFAVPLIAEYGIGDNWAVAKH